MTMLRRASACETSRRNTPRSTSSATTRLAREGSTRIISATVPTVVSVSVRLARRTTSSTSRWEMSSSGATCWIASRPTRRRPIMSRMRDIDWPMRSISAVFSAGGGAAVFGAWSMRQI
ncbi:MAG: hypothetical protein BGO05_08245 [Rhizobiales bacterium 63-7]|nr:MAG: hypothetical protein BGO05_08245 [Rhizobiales bacterium 63-7]